MKIGEETTEILEYTPANFYKIVILRPKYAKAHNKGVLIAEMPSCHIEKCLAGNFLLAFILISKYVDHLPLYRQQQIFKRRGIQIASSTIDSWVEKLGFLLEPLYNADLHIDNNLIENSIRPNALGRKNYLFAGSHQGAQRTAMFYTFMGKCKLNGVNPEKWLAKVLSQIADHKANKLYELFPQNLEL